MKRKKISSTIVIILAMCLAITGCSGVRMYTKVPNIIAELCVRNIKSPDSERVWQRKLHIPP